MGGDGEGPVAFVDEVVVLFAQWQQVVEVGVSAVEPPDDVVDSAAVEAGVAVWVGAGAAVSFSAPRSVALSIMALTSE